METRYSEMSNFVLLQQHDYSLSGEIHIYYNVLSKEVIIIKPVSSRHRIHHIQPNKGYEFGKLHHDTF
jgi:hypothetical protein